MGMRQKIRKKTHAKPTVAVSSSIVRASPYTAQAKRDERIDPPQDVNDTWDQVLWRIDWLLPKITPPAPRLKQPSPAILALTDVSAGDDMAAGENGEIADGAGAA